MSAIQKKFSKTACIFQFSSIFLYLIFFFITKRKNKVESAFIGLHDTVEENHFTWFKGNLDGGYKKWCKNEPNNHNSKEDCVELKAKGCLNDLNCARSKPFICEINDKKINVSYF